jgi:enoyl-[acyl-carrier protein] reductase II
MLLTPLCELLGIRHPIIQAPIWPGAAPELAAAVSEAGALGSVAAVFSSVERLTDHIARVRALTNRPFAVNHVVSFLDEAAFVATLEARPAVISLSQGDPGTLVARAHEAGIKVIHQVHTVRQGREAAARGVDAIIAQGMEAGGQGQAKGVGTMALVPQLVDAVGPIPVIAAGGIADGRGLAAAITLGAAGVNMGTRFLASFEADGAEEWKRAVLETESEDSIRFEEWEEIFPARPGIYPVSPRVLPSAFMAQWHGRPEDVRSEAIRLKQEILAVVREHRMDKLLPFGGQTAGLIKTLLPARQIVQDIVADAVSALARASAQSEA